MAESPIEAHNHAIDLWRLGFDQPVLNAQLLAQLVEFMLACRMETVATTQPFSELFAVVSENGANLEVCRLAQRCQEGFGRCCRLVLFDRDEHPADRSVDDHKHVAALVLTCYLGQIFHIDMHIA